MASPILNVTQNKQVFSPGDPMVFTVTYSDPDNVTDTFDLSGTDSAGHTTTLHQTITISDPVTLPNSILTALGRTLTKVSDASGVAVYNGIA